MKQKEIISKKEFRKDLWQLALPVTLQCVLQSSFSVVDQVMTGQLGSENIAAIGIGSRFIFLLTVIVQAIGAGAGIIIAQAAGREDEREAKRGLYTSLGLALIFSVGFTAASLLFPEKLIGIYSKDNETVGRAVFYLRIYAVSFLPMTITSLFSVYLRCVKAAFIPLYAGFGGAFLNSGLNYLLIFGKWGFPEMGIEGAAWASVISQIAGSLVIFCVFFVRYGVKKRFWVGVYRKKAEWREYLEILLPMFICEFFWAFGENVYAFIYSHMGTRPYAAMTLIYPLVSMSVGVLTGVSQAAGIMTGNLLGAGEDEKAYETAKELMKTGLIVSLGLCVLMFLIRPFYVQIFKVESEVRETTAMIVTAFVLLFPVKVQNMILGGGVLRSGGKTKYIMAVDLLGTWAVGVPVGFVSAFLLKLPIAEVYFLLSLEEVVRLGISGRLFQKRVWMRRL